MSNTSKKQDLIDLFGRDIKIYGKKTKEIKELLKEGFIKESKKGGKVFFEKA